jgi:anti-sigma factor RsiW
MTPQHLDDDALSATLDGEATPDEQAHVDACPACRARAAELRAAANLIGAPLAVVDPGARDAAIAAALVAAPTPLAGRRRARPPGWLVGAAAAVVALGILVPLVNRTSRSNDGADTAASGSALSKSTESRAAQDSAASGAASPMLAPAPAGADLGAIAGDDELRDRVLDALRAPAPAAPTSTTAAAASGDADPCTTAVTGRDPALGALRLDARATLDGTPVRVLVFELRAEPSDLRALAVTDACDVRRSVTFPAP